MPKPGGTVARGYGHQHRRLRLQWQTIVNSGQAHCARCGGWIAPGTPWHLDHDDTRQVYIGVSHARCNLLDGARKGYRAQQRALNAMAIRRQRW